MHVEIYFRELNLKKRVFEENIMDRVKIIKVEVMD